MKKRYAFYLVAVILFLFSLENCREKLPNNDSSQIIIKTKVNQELQQTANFIGGLPVPENSKWHKYTLLPEYQRYKKLINIVWQKYSANSLSPIEKWRKTQLQDIKEKVIFYPFSGPDIINPLTLFPNSKEYIMLGLEKIGFVPKIEKLNPFLIRFGLQAILPALGHILGRNYFITSDMLKKVGRSPFNGITSLMMLFIVRLNNELIQVDKVSLNALGEAVVNTNPQPSSPIPLQWRKKKKSSINGVRIIFRDKATKIVKTAYFFTGDASDTGLSRKPEFYNFILKRSKFFTLLKASSYLMFNKEFDDIRSIILARSTGVLQGASGLPFHFFNNVHWDLSIYGEYFVPISDFTSRCQPDMVRRFKNDSLGALPFSYDYHYQPGKSNMVIARRSPAHKFYSPKFDFANTVGTDTNCIGYTFMIRNTKQNRQVVNASPYL